VLLPMTLLPSQEQKVIASMVHGCAGTHDQAISQPAGPAHISPAPHSDCDAHGLPVAAAGGGDACAGGGGFDPHAAKARTASSESQRMGHLTIRAPLSAWDPHR